MEASGRAKLPSVMGIFRAGFRHRSPYLLLVPIVFESDNFLNSSSLGGVLRKEPEYIEFHVTNNTCATYLPLMYAGTTQNWISLRQMVRYEVLQVFLV